ncbi:MAG: 4Fe-4S binding protein [Clostridiales bacterium]|jgi:ferredoxin|nr:4Fe-4S binding protein [Clostridiales bacterium]
MIRQIIRIDEDLCNGCGLCVDACHEAAIGIINGKAKLLRDDYCDGLGNCLPVCPTGAITFEEREALPFNEEEVKKNMMKQKEKESKQEEIQKAPVAMHSCPGSRMMKLNQNASQNTREQEKVSEEGKTSMLGQWPVQIQLVPPNAPYFNQADLLIAADCTAYAYRDVHSFMKNKITLIGCPKLDDVDYSVKLTQILTLNEIKSITILRMEVPCCGGIVNAVKTAFTKSGKMIPWRVITIGTDGTIIEDL